MVVIVRRNNGGTKPIERLNAMVITNAAGTKIALLRTLDRRFQGAKNLSETCG